MQCVLCKTKQSVTRVSLTAPQFGCSQKMSVFLVTASSSDGFSKPIVSALRSSITDADVQLLEVCVGCRPPAGDGCARVRGPAHARSSVTPHPHPLHR
jgi:hypothetical protein